MNKILIGKIIKKSMKGNVVNNKISIAPMVDRTDRNFRNFVRMINKDVLLYTVMLTSQAFLNGD